MDEVKVEETPTSTHTTINRTETPSTGGGSMIWFLVGELAVAVVVIGYFVMGDGLPATSSAPAGGNVSVDIETAPAPAADASPEAAPTQEAPEPAVADE